MRRKKMTDLAKNTTIRWLTFNKVLIIVLLLVAFFGYMDSQNLQGVFALDAQYQADNGWSASNNIWEIYWTNIQPALIALWYVVLAIIATTWYLVTKDKSESLALFLVPAILIGFGAQDLIYFLFSPQRMDVIGCWADNILPVNIISNILGEDCPTQASFFISSLFGVCISYLTLYKLKYLEPTKRGKKR
jgi:type IV secretory pathway VirB2 component (pilin)